MAALVLNRTQKTEVIDASAPNCVKCRSKMVATRVDTKVSETGIGSSKTYECTRCGMTELVWTARAWRRT
jgi:hypothetical protein